MPSSPMPIDLLPIIVEKYKYQRATNYPRIDSKQHKCNIFSIRETSDILTEEHKFNQEFIKEIKHLQNIHGTSTEKFAWQQAILTLENHNERLHFDTDKTNIIYTSLTFLFGLSTFSPNDFFKECEKVTQCIQCLFLKIGIPAVISLFLIYLIFTLYITRPKNCRALMHNKELVNLIKTNIDQFTAPE